LATPKWLPAGTKDRGHSSTCLWHDQHSSASNCVGVPSNVTLQHSSIIRSFLIVMPYLAEFFLATYLAGFTQHISSCLRHISHRVYITQLIVPVWLIVIVFAPHFTMCQLHTCASTHHTMYLTVFSIRTSSCSHYVCHRVSTTYRV